MVIFEVSADLELEGIEPGKLSSGDPIESEKAGELGGRMGGSRSWCAGLDCVACCFEDCRLAAGHADAGADDTAASASALPSMPSAVALELMVNSTQGDDGEHADYCLCLCLAMFLAPTTSALGSISSHSFNHSFIQMQHASSRAAFRFVAPKFCNDRKGRASCRCIHVA